MITFFLAQIKPFDDSFWSRTSAVFCLKSVLYTESKKYETTNEVMLVYLNMKDLWIWNLILHALQLLKKILTQVGFTNLPLFKVSKC